LLLLLFAAAAAVVTAGAAAAPTGGQGRTQFFLEHGFWLLGFLLCVVTKAAVGELVERTSVFIKCLLVSAEGGLSLCMFVCVVISVSTDECIKKVVVDEEDIEHTVLHKLAGTLLRREHEARHRCRWIEAQESSSE
jgi:uncharacterized protein (DUF39 family)